jgi:FKBP-type peptidyl-prolyl cis-trans isomerase 2
LPEDAFGERDAELLTEDIIEVGGFITGKDEDGKEVSFAANGIENEIASLDGNHPLAGDTLDSMIKIQGILGRHGRRDTRRKGVQTVTISPSGNGYPGS